LECAEIFELEEKDIEIQNKDLFIVFLKRPKREERKMLNRSRYPIKQPVIFSI